MPTLSLLHRERQAALPGAATTWPISEVSTGIPAPAPCPVEAPGSGAGLSPPGSRFRRWPAVAEPVGTTCAGSPTSAFPRRSSEHQPYGGGPPGLPVPSRGPLSAVSDTGRLLDPPGGDRRLGLQPLDCP